MKFYPFFCENKYMGFLRFLGIGRGPSYSKLRFSTGSFSELKASVVNLRASLTKEEKQFPHLSIFNFSAANVGNVILGTRNFTIGQNSECSMVLSTAFLEHGGRKMKLQIPENILTISPEGNSYRVSVDTPSNRVQVMFENQPLRHGFVANVGEGGLLSINFTSPFNPKYVVGTLSIRINVPMKKNPFFEEPIKRRRNTDIDPGGDTLSAGVQEREASVPVENLGHTIKATLLYEEKEEAHPPKGKTDLGFANTVGAHPAPVSVPTSIKIHFPISKTSLSIYERPLSEELRFMPSARRESNFYLVKLIGRDIWYKILPGTPVRIPLSGTKDAHFRFSFAEEGDPKSLQLIANSSYGERQVSQNFASAQQLEKSRVILSLEYQGKYKQFEFAYGDPTFFGNVADLSEIGDIRF